VGNGLEQGGHLGVDVLGQSLWSQKTDEATHYAKLSGERAVSEDRGEGFLFSKNPV
jgi:hypothetical protein